MELTIKKEFKDLIPRLSNEEYELLTKSILSDGCRESILLWNGVIVDGHNRYEICTTNNVEFNTSDIDFTDDDAAKIWIIDNQMGRRNINDWVKFELSLKKKDILLKQGREKQKETLGGFKYESSVLSIIDRTDEEETHSTRKIIAEEIGKSTGWVGMAEVVAKKAPEEIKEKLRKNETTVNKVYKEIKKEEKKEEKERIAESAKDLKIKIDFRLGDCESIFDDIPDGSIDCIITDPPYPFEFINTWSKLSKLAKRVLKHNGFCIAYSGQMYLPEVLKRMSEHLDYYWMFNLRHSGNYQLIMGRNIFVSWKPLLIFQNGFKKLESPIEDLVHGTGMSKDHHRWEQAIDELKYLIENFTEPGQSILDPFSGSGTTLIASYKLNRKPIGCELSEIEFNNAKRRIYDDLHI